MIGRHNAEQQRRDSNSEALGRPFLDPRTHRFPIIDENRKKSEGKGGRIAVPPWGLLLGTSQVEIETCFRRG